MTYSSGSWPSTSKASLFLSNRGRCSQTDTKKSFILLASSSTFPAVVLFARLCSPTFDMSGFFLTHYFFNIFPPILGSRFMHCCCSVNLIAQRPGFNYVHSHMGTWSFSN